MNILVFGATGMVGQGALRECLRDAGVPLVRTVGRTATGVLRRAFPNYILTTEEIGRAMLAAARQGAPQRVLEAKDIRAMVSGIRN